MVTADLTGSGTLSAKPGFKPSLTGSGALAATATRGFKPSLAGSGVLEATYEAFYNGELALTILNPDLDRAPTSLTLSLTGGKPMSVVSLAIDGAQVATATTDSEGYLAGATIEIDDRWAAGTHTLFASQSGSSTATAPFTLQRGPMVYPKGTSPDTEPVSTAPGRFVLQDLQPGGLGSYVMPKSPARMTSPHAPRVLGHRATTAGTLHIHEGGPQPQEWTISGVTTTQDEHDKLRAYAQLRRRFYVIDHRSRAWTVISGGCELVPRRRAAVGGATTDWIFDYAFRFFILDPDYKEPK
jgi:hypothetical protein